MIRVKDWPSFKLSALCKVKDARRFWQGIDPREFVGGLVYDIDSGDIGLVAVDATGDKWRPKWKDIYLYLVIYNSKSGFVSEGGQFARRLVPLVPPHMAQQVVGLFSLYQQDLTSHAGLHLTSFRTQQTQQQAEATDGGEAV